MLYSRLCFSHLQTPHQTSTKLYESKGFKVLPYVDDLHFRVEQYEKLDLSEEKIAVIVQPEQYIPYDIIASILRLS